MTFDMPIEPPGCTPEEEIDWAWKELCINNPAMEGVIDGCNLDGLDLDSKLKCVVLATIAKLNPVQPKALGYHAKELDNINHAIRVPQLLVEPESGQAYLVGSWCPEVDVESVVKINTMLLATKREGGDTDT